MLDGFEKAYLESVCRILCLTEQHTNTQALFLITFDPLYQGFLPMYSIKAVQNIYNKIFLITKSVHFLLFLKHSNYYLHINYYIFR